MGHEQPYNIVAILACERLLPSVNQPLTTVLFALAALALTCAPGPRADGDREGLETAKNSRSFTHKKPRTGRGFLNHFVRIQAFFLRLAAPIPRRPMPSRARVPGSGTGTRESVRVP